MENEIKFRLQLTTQQLYNLLFLIFFANIFFLTGTWYIRFDYTFWHPLKQLDLQAENVIATWYSSMILFLTAIMSAVCFIADKSRFTVKPVKYLNYGWLLFALIFTLLSFDEMGSFHEEMGSQPLFRLAGEYLGMGQGSGWIIFMVLIGLVGLFMFSFSLIRLRQSPWALIFIIIGILLFLSNRFQEDYEINAMRAAPDPDKWIRPVFLILLEEGSEIFGTWCFLISTTLYALQTTRKKNAPRGAHSKGIIIGFVLNQKITIIVIGMLILLMGISTVLSSMYFNNEMGYEKGIAKNWFPSITAFLNSIICLYIFTARGSINRNKIIYLFLSMFSMLLSLYYGSNMYSNYMHIWTHSYNTVIVFNTVTILFSLSFGIVLLRRVQDNLWRVAILVSVIALILALTTFSPGTPYSAEIAYLASSILLGLLTASIFKPQLVNV